ncbi:MAG: hypothetical protein CL943_01790 [Candidatus Diapherotrites archaeon]|uniref:SGNH hydrolase-type esterase domain-containing protein n=1 Tax=Candidatus Iainarchaeum sp. TaxID=3101447 RepID=A0A2D6M0T4_9ARCH|nr:hypothetical protein [Candidatus Diapherotrites archaeon]|tara:strand:+ start:14394 stop:15497 length:1104 start_codon:yes stop_codon:yes gene_type:complete
MNLQAKKIAQNLLLIMFGLLIGFLLLEVGLRLAVFVTPGIPPSPKLGEFNEELGWSYIPSVDGWEQKPAFFKDSGVVLPPRLVDININSFGFRDREWVLDDDKTRIAFVGDSHIFGHGIDFGDRASDLIQTEQCQSLNFGVSGYSTDQELLLARKTIFPMNADVIILGLFLGNDVEDNAVPFSANTTTTKPYFVLENQELVLKNYPISKIGRESDERQTHFLLGLKRWLNQNIYSYSFIVSLLRSIPLTNNFLVGVEKGRDFTPDLEITVALVKQFNEEAIANNSELIVIFIPAPNQVRKSDDKRNPWISYLTESFEQNNITYIDLLSEFKKNSDQYFYFAFDEHLDENGNKKMAELLLQQPVLSKC